MGGLMYIDEVSYCPVTRAAIMLDAGHNLPEGVSLFDIHHGKHSTLFFLQTPKERITIPIENGDNLVARFHKLLEDTMKGKEIGMKKSASKAAKAYDEKIDKKKGYAEGSKADIKADKAAMKKFPAKKKGK